MSIRAHNLEIIPSLRSLFSVYPSLGLIDDLPPIRKPLHFKTVGETLGRGWGGCHSPWGLIAGAECFLFETAGLLLTNKPFTWDPDWRSNSWGVGGCLCAHMVSKCLHTQRALPPPRPFPSPTNCCSWDRHRWSQHACHVGIALAQKEH